MTTHSDAPIPAPSAWSRLAAVSPDPIDNRKADPDIDWPIARLTFDGDGHITKARAYTPSLPAGEHDVWCIPVARPTPPEAAA